jgi:hypothetical protein
LLGRMDARFQLGQPVGVAFGGAMSGWQAGCWSL